MYKLFYMFVFAFAIQISTT